ASEANAGAVFVPGRDVDRQGALACHPSRARTGRTRVFDHLAAALADRTGALEREEAALGVADAAVAVAMQTGLWLGAGLGADARAGLAGHRRRQPHLRG